jgi:hypothetical protein
MSYLRTNDKSCPIFRPSDTQTPKRERERGFLRGFANQSLESLYLIVISLTKSLILRFHAYFYRLIFVHKHA